MFLKSLHILNFKNYGEAFLSFSEKFILLNGDNGSGKTNLLDAIYFLCLCKSYFTRQDSLLPHSGSTFFRLDGTFRMEEKDCAITCKYRDGRKEFYRNDVLYNRLSDHIGLIPAVMIAPDDTQMISGPPDLRRRFLDAAMAQTDPAYLHSLLQYNKILMQRNSLLKKAAAEDKPDLTLVQVLNSQLAAEGNRIYTARKSYIEIFRGIFQELYVELSDSRDAVEIRHVSQLEGNDHLHLLMHTLRDDLRAGRTTTGIHRDDLELTLDGRPLRERGSQGQIKSCLLALKLAQFRMILNLKQKNPVLLLDDIFEKLDRNRLEKLFSILHTDAFTQVFLTDADADRSRDLCASHVHNFSTFLVRDGKIEYIC